jgi:Family of unknown function (DUF6884)
MRVAIVGCSKNKALPDIGERTMPARRLYGASALFRKAMAFAEANADRTLIASAKYGLVEPDRELAPYDLALGDLPAAARRVWGIGVAAQLRDAFPSTVGVTLVLLVGRAYAIELLRDAQRWAAVEQPLQGLGIGHRLRALTPPADSC